MSMALIPYQAFSNELVKIALESGGHTISTVPALKSMKAGPAASRIITDAAAHTADAEIPASTKSRIQKLRSEGGLLNRAKAKALSVSSRVGQAADYATSSPFNPAAQTQHAFPSGYNTTAANDPNLLKARQGIVTGRQVAGDRLARAALEQDPARRARMATEAFQGVGRDVFHRSQDVKPHFVGVNNAGQRALAGDYGRARQFAAHVPEYVPKSLRPMVSSGIAHKLTDIDAQENISRRDLRASAKQGHKVRIKAIEALRYEHNIPTQEATRMVDELMQINPTAVQEAAGKATGRAKDVKSVAGRLVRKVLRRGR